MNKKLIIFILLVLICGICFSEEVSKQKDNMSFIIIASVISLVVLGVLFGIGLGIASKVFEVKTDPKAEEINEILPQIQCGMCGKAGCAAFAEAVAKGEAPPNGCVPGGEEVAKKIGEILGVKVEIKIPDVATILCTRKRDVKKRLEYYGVKDCRAVLAVCPSNIYECAFACIGLGTCEKVCPFNAIYMDEDGMPKVIEEKCTGCGICVENCPLNIIKLTPRDKNVHILCVSTEHPKIRAKVHRPGACIGCGKCVKACPQKAISLIDKLAVIDYTKCTNCGECIKVCPTKAIHNIREPKVSKAS